MLVANADGIEAQIFHVEYCSRGCRDYTKESGLGRAWVRAVEQCSEELFQDVFIISETDAGVVRMMPIATDNLIGCRRANTIQAPASF